MPRIVTPRPARKRTRYPVGVLAVPQIGSLPPSIFSTARSSPLSVTVNGNFSSRGRDRWVGGPSRSPRSMLPRRCDMVHFAAGLFAFVRAAGWCRCENMPWVPRRSGSAHGRQLHAAELFGRKGDRHAEDAVENAVVAEDGPERLALAQQTHVGLAAGQCGTFPSRSVRRGGADLDGTELRLIGPLVRREEVEDVVLAGIRAGLKGGPGHRRDRRQACCPEA